MTNKTVPLYYSWVGFAFIVGGLYWAWPPLGCVALGILLGGAGVLAYHDAKQQESPDDTRPV